MGWAASGSGVALGAVLPFFYAVSLSHSSTLARSNPNKSLRPTPMPLSRRSLLAGLATVAAVPAAQGAAIDDAVTVRTVPPVAGWPDWEMIDPNEREPEF